MLSYTHIAAHKYINIYIRTYIHTYIHIYIIHTHIHTYEHAYVRTYIHRVRYRNMNPITFYPINNEWYLIIGKNFLFLSNTRKQRLF